MAKGRPKTAAKKATPPVETPEVAAPEAEGIEPVEDAAVVEPVESTPATEPTPEPSPEPAHRIDETVPGGRYLVDGVWKNARGEVIE